MNKKKRKIKRRGDLSGETFSWWHYPPRVSAHPLSLTYNNPPAEDGDEGPLINSCQGPNVCPHVLSFSGPTCEILVQGRDNLVDIHLELSFSQPEVTLEWLSLFLRTPEAPTSSPTLKRGKSNWGYLCFSSVSPGSFLDSVLPNPFQVICHDHMTIKHYVT